MTTAAMVIGVTPLLIANGAGAKSRFDIGVVIAAGMTIGTLFTLFITPAIYSYVARDRRHMHDRENASDVLGRISLRRPMTRAGAEGGGVGRSRRFIPTLHHGRA